MRPRAEGNAIGSGADTYPASMPRSARLRAGRSVTSALTASDSPSVTREIDGSAAGVPATSTTEEPPAARTHETDENSRSRSDTVPSGSLTARPSNPSRHRANTIRPSGSGA